MSPIRAAAATRIFPSMPTKRRAAGWRASRISGSPAASSSRRSKPRIPTFRTRSICGAGREPRSNSVTQFAVRASHYNELHDAGGAIRAHWQPLTDALSAMTPGEYARRRAAADGMIRDNGVTYNVYDEAGGHARPWQLDVVPFVISAADWRVIEAGIIQRAMLANEVLRDIYGPQKLIAEAHLPPHLVFGHPQFLRPLMEVAPAGGVHVHLYSIDLARTPDGSWIVLSSPRGCAERAWLRARKPHRRQPDLPRPVRRDARPAARGVLQRPSPICAFAGGARPRGFSVAGTA